MLDNLLPQQPCPAGLRSRRIRVGITGQIRLVGIAWLAATAGGWLANGTPGTCLFAQVSLRDPSLFDTAAIDYFEEHVRPLLTAKCFSCHAKDSKKQGGGLVLDSREGWQRGGDLGPAIVPGDAQASLVMQAIRWTSDELQMPPDGRLTNAEIEVFDTWIRNGAHDPRTERHTTPATTMNVESGRNFWAFRSPRGSPHDRPTIVPAADQSAWAQNEIDLFVLAQQLPRQLRHSPAADKRTLIRRATFDIIGLPPTPQEVDAFLADDRPTAFADLIDRLMASPHYGERWGRYWLNVARYADSNGLDENIAHGNAWRYRDYVVDSFNRDKPYSTFVCEQLAGDLMPPVDDDAIMRERLIATGFLSLGPKVLAEVDETKMEMDIIDEQVETVGRAFLALTLGCARCHDHKFDPIPTADYYALAGIFKSTKTMEHFTKIAKWNEASIETSAQRATRESIESQIADVNASVRDLLRPKQTAVSSDSSDEAASAKQQATDITEEMLDAASRQRLAELREALKMLTADLPAIPTAMAVADLATPVNLRIHVRGSHLTQTEEVARHFPTVLCGPDNLPTAIPATRSGRLELAEWLVNGRNPLTARVIVNRVWDWHFGRGLVDSPDNFGKLGSEPSHPELLDWLAERFVADGWSLKSLHRRIMLSATYQQASHTNNDCATIDPDNRYLWRANLRRLDAEAIRDAVLDVSGQLDRTPRGSLLHVGNREFLFDHTSKDTTKYDSTRRSLYLPVIRNHLYDAFQLFDYTDASVMHSHRPSTVVAPQALFLMNSPLILDATWSFADRLLTEQHADSRQLIEQAFDLAFARPPSAAERDACLSAMKQFENTLDGNSPTNAAGEPVEFATDFDATARRRNALAVVCQTLLMSNEFIHIR